MFAHERQNIWDQAVALRSPSSAGLAVSHCSSMAHVTPRVQFPVSAPLPPFTKLPFQGPYGDALYNQAKKELHPRIRLHPNPKMDEPTGQVQQHPCSTTVLPWQKRLLFSFRPFNGQCCSCSVCWALLCCGSGVRGFLASLTYQCTEGLFVLYATWSCRFCREPSTPRVKFPPLRGLSTT